MRDDEDMATSSIVDVRASSSEFGSTSLPDEQIICHLKPFAGNSPAAYNNFDESITDDAFPQGDAVTESAFVEAGDEVCHWCCHQFPGDPVRIPTKRAAHDNADDGFVATGHFCSYPCAAAAIFDEHLDNNTAWTRYQFLNDMFAAAGDSECSLPIVRAPPRSALKMFGGSMTIDEFRKKAGASMCVVRRCPPMMVDTPRLEEIPVCHQPTKGTYVPLDDDRISKYKVRLERSKPKKNFMNTLDYVLGGKSPQNPPLME